MAEVNESMRRLGLGGGGGKFTFFTNWWKSFHKKIIVTSFSAPYNLHWWLLDDDAEVEEWEAELEGELNEFEVVSSKDGNEDPTDDMTETQIQEMLDAEDGTSSTDSLKRK